VVYQNSEVAQDRTKTSSRHAVPIFNALAEPNQLLHFAANKPEYWHYSAEKTVQDITA